MRTKTFKLLPLLLILVLVISACSGNGKKEDSSKSSGTDSSGKSEQADQVLNLVDSSEIPSMDSTLATDNASFTVMNNVYEGLYRVDEDENPVPGVAESTDISPDGLVYTFKLNKNAKWSNGDPVTAHDFIYAWKKVLHPDTAAEYAYIMGPIKNVNAIIDTENPLFGKVDELGAKAIDDHTLEVTLEAPAPYFLGLTSFPTFLPQNEKFVKAQGDKYALETANMLYNGPFVLSEWKHNEGWQYKKNNQYWDKDTVKLEEINVKIVKDTATRINLYESGAVDRAVLDAEYVDKYKDSADFDTYMETTMFFLRLNQAVKGLDNVDIRKAIDMGWDKETHAKVMLNNGSKPAYYLVPEGLVNSPDGEDFRKANGTFGKFDAKKAQEHWKKGLKAIGKDKLEIEFLIYDTEGSKKDGEYIKNQLEKNLPGLTIKLKAQPFKQKLALESAQDYQMSYAGWGPDYQDAMTFLDMWITDGSHNQMNYSNPEYDKLIKDAKSETDTQKRWDMLLKAEKILLEEDQAISPMFQRGRAYLQREKVKQLQTNSFGGEFTYKWTYIK